MDHLYLFAWPCAFVYVFLACLHFSFICLHVFVLCCHNVEHILHPLSLPQLPWLPPLEQGPNDEKCCWGPGNYLLLTFTVSTTTNQHARTLTTRNNNNHHRHHHHHTSHCHHEPPLLVGYIQGAWWHGNNNDTNDDGVNTNVANTNAKHPISSLASHFSWGDHEVFLSNNNDQHLPPALQGSQTTTTVRNGINRRPKQCWQCSPHPSLVSNCLQGGSGVLWTMMTRMTSNNKQLLVIIFFFTFFHSFFGFIRFFLFLSFLTTSSFFLSLWVSFILLCSSCKYMGLILCSKDWF